MVVNLICNVILKIVIMNKLILEGAKNLSKNEMKNVKEGVSKEEYCNTLRMILENNTITYDACEGASHGANDAGCSFSFTCD